MGCVGLVAVLGCAEDVPITAEPGRQLLQREWNAATAPAPWVDLMLVLEDADRTAALEPARALVRRLATGDADGDGAADHFAFAHVRVAVVNADELAALAMPSAGRPGAWQADCSGETQCAAPWRVAGYHYAPYGFAPSVDAFVDGVDCLLDDDAACVPDRYELLGPFLSAPTEAITRVDLQDIDATVDRLLACGVSVDVAQLELEGLLFDGDRVQCEFTEALPTVGPITRCDQLTNFGRRFDHVDEVGREVCQLDQLAVNGLGATDDDYGFYFHDSEDTPAPPAPQAVPAPQFALCASHVAAGPSIALQRNTPVVPTSGVALRCVFSP